MRELRTFSMPELETYEKFKLICKREGDTVSSKLYEFIKVYVKQHSHGNPQTLMTSHLAPPKKTSLECPFFDPVETCNPSAWTDPCSLSKKYLCPKPRTIPMKGK